MSKYLKDPEKNQEGSTSYHTKEEQYDLPHFLMIKKTEDD